MWRTLSRMLWTGMGSCAFSHLIVCSTNGKTVTSQAVGAILLCLSIWPSQLTLDRHPRVSVRHLVVTFLRPFTPWNLRFVPRLGPPRRLETSRVRVSFALCLPRSLFTPWPPNFASYLPLPVTAVLTVLLCFARRCVIKLMGLCGPGVCALAVCAVCV